MSLLADFLGKVVGIKTTVTNGEHVPHVIVDSQPASGGGGDATAANQDEQTAHLSDIETSIGASTEAEATGNGSVIAILKRIRTLLGLNPQTTLSSLGIEAKTISTGSVSLTPAGGAKHALISFVGTEGDFVRFRMDGSAVTSTTGQKLKVGDYLDLTDPFGNYSTILTNLRFIRDTAASADVVAHAEYFD